MTHKISKNYQPSDERPIDTMIVSCRLTFGVLDLLFFRYSTELSQCQRQLRCLDQQARAHSLASPSRKGLF